MLRTRYNESHELKNKYTTGYPGGSESAFNVWDPGSILGSGRFPGEGNGNPLQYACLENPMDRGAWRIVVHGLPKSRTRLSNWLSLFHLKEIKEDLNKCQGITFLWTRCLHILWCQFFQIVCKLKVILIIISVGVFYKFRSWFYINKSFEIMSKYRGIKFYAFKIVESYIYQESKSLV